MAVESRQKLINSSGAPGRRAALTTRRPCSEDGSHLALWRPLHWQRWMMLLVPLRVLKKPDVVPVCIFDRGNQPSSTNVLDRLQCLRASLQKLFQTGLYVGDGHVNDRPRHPFALAMGIQPDFLLSHPKAHIIRLIRIRLNPQKRAVERLRLREVADGIDDHSDSLIHKTTPSPIHYTSQF